MSLPLTIPVESRPFLTSNTFDADFGFPTVNVYDFGKAGNTDVSVLNLDRHSVYILERVNFSMDIDEGDFQQSISVVPTIILSKLVSKSPIWPTPQPFVNYIDNLEMLTFFWTQNSGDALRMTFNGILNQIPATVGKFTINAFVQLNIYEVTSQEWKKHFLDPKNKLGVNLNMRGGFGTVPRSNLG